MDQAELAAVHARAEAELTKIPGVVGVGFGRKETGGRITDEVSLRVYVAEKKATADLSPGETIPPDFEGIPTDVLVVRDVELMACEDQTTHSPLIGGISITDFHDDGSGGSGLGTLGFFATLNGTTGPNNVVLVTNQHVLARSAAGGTVSHPQWGDQAGTRAMVRGTGAIAKVHTIPPAGDHRFAYPGEPATDHYVDAASAKLDICVSSWCGTNCGVSYKNEIRGLDIGGVDRIDGVARVAQSDLDAAGDYVVFKVGRTTSRTKGNVIDVAAVVRGGHRVIEIDAAEPDCEGIDQFAAKGDSGSAVVNARNELVGLLFAVAAADASRGLACHIHPVLDRLGVTPISTANPPVAPAGKLAASGAGAGADQTIPLRDRFTSTAAGAELYGEFLARRAEVVALVNHHRRVTIAWHRSKGPSFLAGAVENARDPAHPVPREIDGVDRETLIRRMAAALAEHGSDELRVSVERWLPRLVAHLEHFDSLHDVVDRLAGDPEPLTP